MEKLFVKEYIILIWLAILALCFIIMANELFIIYLALELQNLILYVLTNLRRKISIAIEAGIKYYIMGSFSSCILLYGLVMLFGIFGTLDLIEINYLISGSLFENILSL
jgi:NADH-quinone oxidoreductase subunit N